MYSEFPFTDHHSISICRAFTEGNKMMVEDLYALGYQWQPRFASQVLLYFIIAFASLSYKEQISWVKYKSYWPFMTFSSRSSKLRTT